MKKGFTLIEVLTSLCIVVIFFLMLYIAFYVGNKNKKITETEKTMQKLLVSPKYSTEDAWGNRITDTGTHLISAGPDEKMYTADDIIVEK